MAILWERAHSEQYREPVDSQRLKAVNRLRAFAHAPIEHWAFMPEEAVGPFDLAVANHVLFG
jgi:hypothetical protein